MTRLRKLWVARASLGLVMTGLAYLATSWVLHEFLLLGGSFLLGNALYWLVAWLRERRKERQWQKK